MTAIDQVRGRVVVLAVDDIDTDQIIPARFLKVTDKAGCGAHLFADWRARGDFPLDRPEAAGAPVLVAGRNFGCGSSREHAAWALTGAGFRAVVALSFADIFRANALKNGLLPVEVDASGHAELVAAAARAPTEVTVDVAAATLLMPDGRALAFPIDPFARHCLLAGLDELSYLLSKEAQIAAHEQSGRDGDRP
jgi:3-isopropylmalate/(R)-2-methylmalate dehydratase small subunit